MAITRVKETAQSRGSSRDGRYVQEYTRTFVVESDIVDEESWIVQEAVDPNDGEAIPEIGDPINATTIDGRVVNVETRQRSDAPNVWDVTVKYSSIQTPADADPLDRPADIQWSVNKYQRTIDRARLVGSALYDGPPVGQLGDPLPPRNSARDPFDPPPQRDDGRLRLTITKNLSEFPLIHAGAYQDATNLDAIWGFLPGQLKCGSITGSTFLEQNVTYWRVTYEFEFRAEGWTLKILDAGYRRLKTNDDGTKSPEMINDGRGTILSSPAPLDGFGREWNKPPLLIPPDPVFLEYSVYTKRAFALLGLPNVVT